MKLISIITGIGVAFVCSLFFQRIDEQITNLSHFPPSITSNNINSIFVEENVFSIPSKTKITHQRSLRGKYSNNNDDNDELLSSTNTHEFNFYQKNYEPKPLSSNSNDIQPVYSDTIIVNLQNRNLKSNETINSFTDDYTHVDQSVSIYNALLSIKVLVGSVSVIIIVASVLLVEEFFEKLNRLTNDTPFQELLAAIEKELMVVGTMAFLFKMILNLKLISNHNWILALEYADLVVPITSFIFCIEGMFLIYMSIKQCELWSRSYRLVLVELLDRYFNSRSIWFNEEFTWLPWSTENSEMEFRIFHILFCDQYNIQRNAFAFDEYVERIFEKFLLNTITIQPIDWFIVIIFVLINWARNEININIQCNGNHSCAAESSIKLFTVVGSVILIATSALAIMSRLYELRLLHHRNVTSGKDYVPFLQAEEDGLDAVSEKGRFSSITLRQAISEAKAKSITDKFSPSFLVDFIKRNTLERFGLSSRSGHGGLTSIREERSNASRSVKVASLSSSSSTGKSFIKPPPISNNISTSTSTTTVTSVGLNSKVSPFINQNQSESIIQSKRNTIHIESTISETQEKDSVKSISTSRRPRPENLIVNTIFPLTPEISQLIDIESNSDNNIQNNSNSICDGNDKAGNIPGSSVDRTLPYTNAVDSTINLKDSYEIDSDNNSGNNINSKQITPFTSPLPTNRKYGSAMVVPYDGLITQNSGLVNMNTDPITIGHKQHSGILSLLNPNFVPSTSNSKANSPVNVTNRKRMTPTGMTGVLASPRFLLPTMASDRNLKNVRLIQEKIINKKYEQEMNIDSSDNNNKDGNGNKMPSKIQQVFFNRVTGKVDGVRNKKSIANLERGHAEDLKRVFAFDKPKVYFQSVNMLMMIISFYTALWITNFLSSAINDLRSPMWAILSVLPGILSFGVFIYVVKCAALLKAVLFIDHDLMEETLEQTESSEQLSETLRQKVLFQLQEMGDPENELFNLYHMMDSSGSNALTRKEFQLFLEAMGITFSRKRWQTIFRNIDRDYDNTISFEELVLFVFPSHKSATAEENKRLKAAQNRVNLKIQQYTRLNNNKFSRKSISKVPNIMRKGSII